MTDFLGTVVELWRYPVSAVSGERLEKAVFDRDGVLHDRAFAMIDAQTLQPAAPETEKRWRFAPEMTARLTQDGPEIDVDGNGDWMALASDAARMAASRRAGFAVAFKPLAHRLDEASTALAAPRYDRAPIHLLTTASLASLAALLKPEAQVDVRRFRPNIVVELFRPEPGFPDFSLIGKRLAIGTTIIEITGPCERCSFTALAQNGLPFAKEVMHAIARHGGGGFGVLGNVVHAGNIAVADRLAIISGE